MDPIDLAAVGSLAAALRQFKQSGVPRAALEVALKEVYQDHSPSAKTTARPPQQAGFDLGGSVRDSTQAAPGHAARLSVSTTSSGSSHRSSVRSLATSVSSVSSQPAAAVLHGQSSALVGPPPQRDLPPVPPLVIPSSGGSINGTKPPPPPPRYWCTSCETTFIRKFDWKRHEDEHHERYRRYPCPAPGCKRVFWGSNTFNQHHRQAHACCAGTGHSSCRHADEVVRYTCRKRAWGCGICAAFLPSRERFFDHVARHYEAGDTKPDAWLHGRVIYGLLHQPALYPAWKALVVGLYGENRQRQPMFCWHPETTGRAPGFVEGKSQGMLQDFLEFFDGTADDQDRVQNLVRLAYELADITPRPLVLVSQVPVSRVSPTQVAPAAPLPQRARASLPAVSSTRRSSATTSAVRHRSAPSPTPPPLPPLPPKFQLPMPSAAVAEFQPVPSADPISDVGVAVTADSDVSMADYVHVTSPRQVPAIHLPETIVEEETGVAEPFFDLGAVSANIADGLMVTLDDLLALPATGREFEDWNSLTATVVDETFWMVSGDDTFAQTRPEM